MTLVGPDGAAVTNVPVEGRAASGRGCSPRRRDGLWRYRSTGGLLVFVVPEHLRSAAAELRRATHVYDSLRSLTIDERLSSSPGNAQVSVFHERAPNRLAYKIVSATQAGVAGTEGIVIGSRRWDRSPGGPWKPSPQSPIRVPTTYWSAQARNAYSTGPGALTFYDPQVRAWYRLRVDPRTERPVSLRMVGAAHFMRHRYSVGSTAISPPSAVALRLTLDHLEEARRVLERGQPGLSVARAPRGMAQPPHGCDRPGRADHAAERERAQTPATALIGHANILGCA